MNEDVLEIRSGSGEGRSEDFRDGLVRVITPNGLRPSEALLIDVFPAARPGTYLSVLGRDVLGAEILARLNPGSRVIEFQDDMFFAERSRSRCRELPEDLAIEVIAAADLPDVADGFDGIFLALNRHLDHRYAAELLTQAAARVRVGGLVVASVDNSRDEFVAGKMTRLFGDVTRRESSRPKGLVLISRAKKPVAFPAAYIERFTVTDQGKTLEFASRPGTFAAGRLDDGSRALIADMEITPGTDVLDLGAGIGVIGITAAARTPLHRLVLTEAQVRSAELAQLNMETILGPGHPGEVVCRADAHDAHDALPAGTFDIVLANPPYYADGRIAEYFAGAAARLLKPEGTYQVVTKLQEWHKNHLTFWYGDVRHKRRGGYDIFIARPKRTRTGPVR